MNSIRRLLGEADEDCFAPVLASSSTALMSRQRRARPLFREAEPEAEAEAEAEESKPTRESVVDQLTALAGGLKDDLAQYAPAIKVLAEAISANSVVPYDAQITVSTVRQTNVVVQPRPPEKDPVLAALLGKDPPVSTKPPLEQVQAQKNKQAAPFDAAQPNQPKVPTPQDVQKAMEDAISGKEIPPKIELVESSGMASAMSMFQMESLPATGPLLGAPPTGSSGGAWRAFGKFVKK